MTLRSQTAFAGTLTDAQVCDLIAEACPSKDYRDKRVLLIVPDGTRTAPVGLLFQALYRQVGEVTKAFDVLIALGTHQPMNEAAICRRLEISVAERGQLYRRGRFFYHRRNDPSALERDGGVPAAENKRVWDRVYSRGVAEGGNPAGVWIEKKV